MRIVKIAVRNFRLLRNIEVDLETDLSLIIGKNNCGKTSLLLVLDKFLGGGVPTFAFDDLNIDLRNEIRDAVSPQGFCLGTEPLLGISLKLFINYDDDDNLEHIGNTVLTDLDPDSRTFVLAFEYRLNQDTLTTLRKDYAAYLIGRNSKATISTPVKAKDLFGFLKDSQGKYFIFTKKSLAYDASKGRENDGEFIDLNKSGVRLDRIVNFKWISARRNVSNKNTDKSLSALSLKLYHKIEEVAAKGAIIEDFKDALAATDETLDTLYDDIFEGIIDDVRLFGGIRPEDSSIKIISTLRRSDLLDNNTTVVYGGANDKDMLPESHNGLGYMNLISLIFELRILLHDFRQDKEMRPADINLLFIEEPEAHTHPQMQATFIKNIKTLLSNGVRREDGQVRALQTIITTHSSHIVAESDFHDIKYLRRTKSGIVSKNLRDLEKEYDTPETQAHFKFLKQYLTLHRAELFFADKAILIEGDTERVLLPAMMRKLDQEDALEEATTKISKGAPLCSQNISIVEVGAYSHIFEQFIDFLGITFLIITDLDSVTKTPRQTRDGRLVQDVNGNQIYDLTACAVADGSRTANASLSYYFGSEIELSYFVGLRADQKTLSKDKQTKLWAVDKTGVVTVRYQMDEEDSRGTQYNAASFEDAFFHVNRDFLSSFVLDGDGNISEDHGFQSLVQKHLKAFLDGGTSYELARLGVRSKPSFAIEVLLHSVSKVELLPTVGTVPGRKLTLDFSNWKMPGYISEGLTWLKRA